ncbi:Rhodanese-related sulfurtransferase [Saccharomonospora marina XMU15]|uniref:Rhodanese-related sulfurtransferase n=1 Tax=Saccharomonospora marina XMU15 TaxID=882083 RepID=H5X0R8_9PSEU|nr:rhodanese-like domain-containing protein [Saccharomonospora marina]EHR50864.1 Rhodanese-related sulfurtransferase [Saccharomonospora marina XMU15]
MSREASVEEFAAAQRAGALVVDVREPAEYLGGHVPGARLYPLSSLTSRMAELPRRERIYVICASGNRSAMAASVLEQAGFDARSVAGGMSAWTGDGRPVLRGPRENAA